MGPDVRTVVWLTTAVLTALAVFAVVRNARTPLTQLAVGVIVALALDPLVVATKRRLGVPRHAAVAIVGLGAVIVVTGAIVLLGPPARDQAQRFTTELPETVQQFETLPLVGNLVKRYDVERRVTEWVDELPAKLNEQTLADGINRLLLNVFGALIVGATVIAVLLDGEFLIARFRRLVRDNPARLERLDNVGRVLYTTLGQYFGGSLTVATMMGIFVLIVALAMAIPLAPLAALWAMFTDLIPQVGGFLGGAFLVVLALAKGPVQAIVASVLFVVYMNIENHIITPAVVGQSVNLSPPTTMLAAFVGAAVAGIPGALVATPIVGATKRLYFEFRGRPVETKPRTSLVARWRAAIKRRRAARSGA